MDRKLLLLPIGIVLLLTGCELVMVGNASGCSRILRILQKGFEKDQVKECFPGMRKEDFFTMLFASSADPAKIERALRESVELLERYEPDQGIATVGFEFIPDGIWSGSRQGKE